MSSAIVPNIPSIVLSLNSEKTPVKLDTACSFLDTWNPFNRASRVDSPETSSSSLAFVAYKEWIESQPLSDITEIVKHSHALNPSAAYKTALLFMKNQESPLLEPVFQGKTPPQNRLFEALYSRDASIKVELLEIFTLMALGADLTGSDSQGRTPLYAAVESGKTDAMNALLEAGADPNIQPNSITLLHITALTGCSEATRILMKRGVQCRPIPTLNNRTPLHLAAFFNSVEVVESLIEARSIETGIGLNNKDAFGQTPLHLAVELTPMEREAPRQQAIEDKQVKMVTSLLRAGANQNIRDSRQYTPLDLAKMYGFQNVERVFSEYQKAECSRYERVVPSW